MRAARAGEGVVSEEVQLWPGPTVLWSVHCVTETVLPGGKGAGVPCPPPVSHWPQEDMTSQAPPFRQGYPSGQGCGFEPQQPVPVVAGRQTQGLVTGLWGRGHQQSAPQWSGKAFEEASFKLRPGGCGGSAERKPVACSRWREGRAQHSEQREQHMVLM